MFSLQSIPPKLCFRSNDRTIVLTLSTASYFSCFLSKAKVENHVSSFCMTFALSTMVELHIWRVRSDICIKIIWIWFGGVGQLGALHFNAVLLRRLSLGTGYFLRNITIVAKFKSRQTSFKSSKEDVGEHQKTHLFHCGFTFITQ